MNHAPVQANGCLWNAFGAFGGPNCGVKTTTTTPKQQREKFEQFEQEEKQKTPGEEAKAVVQGQNDALIRPRGPREVMGMTALTS